MYASDTEGEDAPLMHQYGIPTIARDKRTSRQKQLALFFILASTLFERIAFFSLETNANLFFPSNSTIFHWDPQQSPTGLLLIFSGTSYISTLIFAILSDARLGRAKTIIIGFVLYLTGYSLITITAFGSIHICPLDNNGGFTSFLRHTQCYHLILGAFILAAIGAGAVKSNLAVFGAEQIQVSRITSRYFDKYIVAANIGGMIATIITTTTPTNLKPPYLPHLIAGCTLAAAALLFLVGYPYYIHVNLKETVIANCIPVIINAFQSRSRYNRNHRSANEENADPTSSNLNASHSMTDEEIPVRIEQRPSTFLDFANAPNGGKFNDRIVNDVKSLQGAFIVFTLLIAYWLVYNQKDMTFRYQGVYMEGTRPDIVSWMSLGDEVVVIIGILLFNVFIYKCLEARKWSLTIMRKFIIGMCFACIAVFIAGGIENVRVCQCKGDSENSNLSIYTQIPQNIFIGFSQLFAMVASYEYAYFAAPLSAQSLFMSLHFCSAGIASFIGTAYLAVTARFSSNFDFSCQNVKHYTLFFRAHFFIVGGLQLVFILIFILCQKKLRIVRLNPQQTGPNQSAEHEST